MKESIRGLSSKISEYAGSTWAFALAIIGVLVWIITGPYFNFSNTWLIAVTAATDVVVFLMVFSLQATQNRDSKAIQLKLNELIIADKKASNAFIGLESLTDDELGELDEEFKKMLESLSVRPVVHKLHKKIKEEKTHRTKMEHRGSGLVGTLLDSVADSQKN